MIKIMQIIFIFIVAIIISSFNKVHAQGLPDLSSLDRGVQSSIEGACGYYRRMEGPAAYIRCVNKQIVDLKELVLINCYLHCLSHKLEIL